MQSVLGEWAQEAGALDAGQPLPTDLTGEARAGLSTSLNSRQGEWTRGPSWSLFWPQGWGKGGNIL